MKNDARKKRKKMETSKKETDEIDPSVMYESDSMSKNAKIILGCTIALIVFLTFAMGYMFMYLNELTNSPLILGAEKTANQPYVEDLLCTCHYNLKGELQTFNFNSTSLWSDDD